MAPVAVRARVEQIGGRHDRGAGARGVRPDHQLDDDVVLERPLGIRPSARDARDDRQWPEVDEHMPRVAEHDGVVAAQAVLRCRGDCRSTAVSLIRSRRCREALGQQAHEQGGREADDVEVVALDPLDERAPRPWIA